MIIADHGCDPTMPGTDHSREYVPLLVVGNKVQSSNLGIRESFADVAKTIAEYFELDYQTHGTSFLDEILPKEG